ncbi:MAG: hypothetical protein LBJ82_02125, partial [Deltaproteobacteria bacterium]|nr:hypothetical protein [Deltaproteobacteria bacterium]
MSDGRKKVKDLAAELGLPNKDVLAAAREIGVTSAKVAASSLSEADVSRLRGRLAPPSLPEKREVIVRRRRVPPDGLPSPQPELPAEEAPVLAEAPAALAAEAATPPKPEEPAPVPVEKKAARVILRPGEAPAPLPVQPPAPSVEESPETGAAADEEAPAPESPKGRKTTRVVRPAAFSAEPERNASGQTVSSAPMLTAKADQGEGGEGAKRADGASVRIISRPEARQPGVRDPRQDTRAPGGYRPRTDSARPPR